MAPESLPLSRLRTLLQRNLVEPHVQGDGGHADQRENHAVAQHDDQVEHQHHKVDQHGAQLLDQRGRDALIGILALGDIARHALGEEFHGQSQHMPYKFGAGYDGQLALHLGDVEHVQKLDHRADDHEQHHQQQEGIDPFRILTRQQAIHKDLAEGGLNELEDGGDGRGEDDEYDGRGGAAQALPGKGQDALGLAALFEGFAGLQNKFVYDRFKMLYFHRGKGVSLFSTVSMAHGSCAHIVNTRRKGFENTLVCTFKLLCENRFVVPVVYVNAEISVC